MHIAEVLELCDRVTVMRDGQHVRTMPVEEASVRILARLKFLRGTPFDIFGRSRERRVERQLIADYERLVEEMLAGLCPEKLDHAVAILALAESIRGYGFIKDRSIERYRRELEQLRSRWNQARPVPEAELPAATAAAV